MNTPEPSFINTWMWAIFTGAGLLLVLLELVVGVQTGFDFVFIGTAGIIGGLITWPFHSWIATLVVTSIICAAYMIFGRRYVRRRTTVQLQKTNVDAVIGKHGLVLREIARNADGRVKIDNEQWKARSDDSIGAGDEVVVTGIIRNTLIVAKDEGGD